MDIQKLQSISKAIERAAIAHQPQMRKGGSIPYISHPYIVSLLLLEAGCSQNVIIAGLLHDTVEDTALTNNDIKMEFGDCIAQLVEECSEPDKSKPWEERKQHTIDKLHHISIEGCMITCADKLHNISSISAESNIIGEKIWDRFNRKKDKQEWYYRSIIAALDKRIPDFPLLALLKQEVDKVFNR